MSLKPELELWTHITWLSIHFCIKVVTKWKTSQTHHFLSRKWFFETRKTPWQTFGAWENQQTLREDSAELSGDTHFLHCLCHLHHYFPLHFLTLFLSNINNHLWTSPHVSEHCIESLYLSFSIPSFSWHLHWWTSADLWTFHQWPLCLFLLSLMFIFLSSSSHVTARGWCTRWAWYLIGWHKSSKQERGTCSTVWGESPVPNFIAKVPSYIYKIRRLYYPASRQCCKLCKRSNRKVGTLMAVQGYTQGDGG